MILSFRCNPLLKEEIDKLLARGLYPDLSSFCEVALRNQLLLEEGQRHPIATVRSSLVGTGRAWDHKVKMGEPSLITNVSPGVVAETKVITGKLPLPDEFRRESVCKSAPFPLPQATPDLFGSGQVVPVDRWLFGQYNRLLPAKVSIRALAVIAVREGKESLLLDSVSARIAEIAAAFGDYLRSLDSKSDSHRDDALATAFPETGAGGQKGRVRYQNQFVGHTVKGEQGGLLVGLKLATIQVIRNKAHILPTEAGWQLALLENPILDMTSSDSTQRFSEEERAMVLEHIRGFVPVEAFAYSAILGMIVKGICSPEAMNAELFQLLSPNRPSADTKEFVNTQRSGVLGRMTDMGLVTHERKGRNVSRMITSAGKRFLGEVGHPKLASVS